MGYLAVHGEDRVGHQLTRDRADKRGGDALIGLRLQRRAEQLRAAGAEDLVWRGGV